MKSGTASCPGCAAPGRRVDDSTLGGILFLTIHIPFIMMCSVQCESVFHSSLNKANYFNRPAVRVTKEARAVAANPTPPNKGATATATEGGEAESGSGRGKRPERTPTDINIHLTGAILHSKEKRTYHTTRRSQFESNLPLSAS